MKRTDKKQKSILAVLSAFAVVAVVSVCVMIAVLCLTRGDNTVVGEFVPPPFDTSAEAGRPNVPENLGYSELYRGGMDFSAWVCGNVTLDGRDAAVYLTNPESNNVWMKLRITDAQGNILGETGLIRPGEYVKCVSLSRELPAGTAIKMKIMTYEPETYYSMGAVTLSTRIGE